MKLFLSAFCATMMIAPLSYGEGCEKGKCDKDKDETVLAAEKDCGCGDCKQGNCSDCEKCQKKEDKLLSDCGKCKKDGEEEEEGTLLAGKCEKDGDCDKEEEGTLLAGKCKKDCDDDKDEETLAA